MNASNIAVPLDMPSLSLLLHHIRPVVLHPRMQKIRQCSKPPTTAKMPVPSLPIESCPERECRGTMTFDTKTIRYTCNDKPKYHRRDGGLKLMTRCQSRGHAASHSIKSCNRGQQLTRGGSFLQLTEVCDAYQCASCKYSVIKSRGVSSDPSEYPNYM